jgi:hypothetical protein
LTDRRDDEEEGPRLTPWTTPALPPRPGAETSRRVPDRDPAAQEWTAGPAAGGLPPPAWRAEAPPEERRPASVGPEGSRPRRLLPLLAGVAVVALVGVAAVAALAGGGDDVAAPSTGETLSAASPAGSSAAGKPGAQPETAASTVAVAPSRGDGPEQRLEALRQESLAAVPRDGRWVAQLASKYAGMSVPDETSDDGDHTFTAAEVLAEHERLRERLGPAVFLVRTGDYGKRQRVDGQELWVTFATDAAFRTPDDVRSWCAAHFGELAGAALDNACTPRRFNPPRA